MKTTSDLIENEGHMFLAREGLLIIVPMPEPRQWRVIAHVASAAESAPSTIDATSLDNLIEERAGIQFGAHDVTWTSQFDLSHGVADHFRSGRVFVAGDAAHIHSPVGGVARMTSMMTSSVHVARHIRKTISPLILSRLFVQAKLARGVGMLNLSYSKRAMLHGSEELSAGRRLPNPALRDGGRLYDRMNDSGFSWVVFGSGSDVFDPDDPRWSGLPIVVLTNADLAERGGKNAKNRVVLVRPDRYIAAVGATPESLVSALPWSGVAGVGASVDGAADNSIVVV